MNNSKRELSYFLDLSYPVRIVTEPEGSVVAEIEELPGCLSQGESYDEAMRNIEEARRLWIETAYNKGLDIPKPTVSWDYRFSGKMLIRMPRSLHKRLSMTAEREGTSLNQYLVYLLSTRQGCAETLESVYEHIPEMLRPEIHRTFAHMENYYLGGLRWGGLPSNMTLAVRAGA